MDRVKALSVAAAIFFLAPLTAYGLSVGEKVPDFKGESTEGTFSLGEALGEAPLLLIVYVKDFTPTCTGVLRDFRGAYDSFKRAGVGIAAVSRDGLERHEEFTEVLNLPFPLVSDPDGEIIGIFGEKRAVYYIDRDGVVQYVKEGVPGVRRLLYYIMKLKK